MQNILITGIRGFIGFNAIQLYKKTYPKYNYVGIDAETYADQFMIDEKNKWLQDNNVPYYKIDLSKDVKQLEDVIVFHCIDTIINFAAESHVDNSIKNPNIFFQSNVIGVANILNICNKYKTRFRQVSTDEVIGAISPEMVYSQDHPNLNLANEHAMFDPSSPYSSSKASAELICNSYAKTFGTKLTISRCTNNFGPWQMTEKLIPTVISKALANEKIPVYGDGKQRRFWIYVDEHNKAIMDILHHGQLDATYNISPKYEWNDSPVNGNLMYNIDIIKMILKHLEKPESLISYVTDRAAHDRCYFLIADKLKKECGYQDTSDFNQDLSRTIDWYSSVLKKQ